MPSLFPYCVTLAVRGYEIDSFGHVNNAIYLQWLEHARWQLGQQKQAMWSGSEILPVVRHLTLDYRAETLLGDELRLCMWPRSVGQTSFVFGTSIRIIQATHAPHTRCGKLALVAKQVFACVQRPTGKVAVPDAWRPLFPSQDPGDAHLPPEA